MQEGKEQYIDSIKNYTYLGALVILTPSQKSHKNYNKFYNDGYWHHLVTITFISNHNNYVI